MPDLQETFQRLQETKAKLQEMQETRKTLQGIKKEIQNIKKVVRNDTAPDILTVLQSYENSIIIFDNESLLNYLNHLGYNYNYLDFCFAIGSLIDDGIIKRTEDNKYVYINCAKIYLK